MNQFLYPDSICYRRQKYRNNSIQQTKKNNFGILKTNIYNIKIYSTEKPKVLGLGNVIQEGISISKLTYFS